MRLKLILVFSNIITLALTLIDLHNRTYIFIMSVLLLFEFIGMTAVVWYEFSKGIIKSFWIPISSCIINYTYIENFFPYRRIENSSRGDGFSIAVCIGLIVLSFAFAYISKDKVKPVQKIKQNLIIDFVLYSIMLVALCIPNIIVLDAYMDNRCVEQVQCNLDGLTDTYNGDEIKFSPATDTFSVTADTETDICIPAEIEVKKSSEYKTGDTVTLELKRGLIYDWYRIIP